MLFEFDVLTGYRKVVDYKNRTSDAGLYLYEAAYDFYTQAGSGVPVATVGTYIQLAITRGSDKTVRGYADGQKVFEFIDTTDQALADANDALFFFLDDAATSFGEVSAGSVARIRIYDGRLDDTQVAELDLNPLRSTRGDANLDGRVTIQDVVVLGRFIVGLSQSPTQGSESFERADANSNGTIEVGDIVRTVDIILGVPFLKPASDIVPVAALSQGPPEADMAGHLAVPIQLDSQSKIGAMEVLLSFDSSLLEIGTPSLSSDLREVTMIHNVSNGLVRLVFFGTGVERLPSGAEVLAYIPVHYRNSAGAQATVELISGNWADKWARSGSVSIRNGIRSIGRQTAPFSFSLASAQPNPFNPSTQISYNIPVPAHVTLTVYNHLGQEVIQLVDKNHVPGRYTATWAGTNRAGQAVASGVYIYQIATDAGHNAS
ncbi:MAG: T9SS type A sorting domain-containing protein, partial [Candidatus Latescibacteria bacterium]|nr:T9SS type A sorting domain-containing protein [Candidatus Latescibacterota bacterium]